MLNDGIVLFEDYGESLFHIMYEDSVVPDTELSVFAL